MSLSRLLNKPEYFHNPLAVIKKIFRPSGSSQLFTTRWQTKIMADWHDAIGGSIGLFGFYDLATTELLWRLIQPGDFVLDVGANIGYMTGLCSYRTGNDGHVWAFEPNPKLLERIRGNIARLRYDNTKLFEAGLSDKSGVAQLVIPKTYNKNAGIAYVATEPLDEAESVLEIRLLKLDDIIPPGVNVNVMKIDVEGHELAVFNGATALFAEKRIKHIIFEDLQQYPSETSRFLSRYGYKIYRISKKLNSLKLEDPLTPPSYPAKTTNYVATLEEDKLRSVIADPGYKCMMKTGNKDR